MKFSGLRYRENCKNTSILRVFFVKCIILGYSDKIYSGLEML